MGVNTAIPYGIVRVGDGYGTLTELLNATSITKLMIQDPEHLEEPVRYYVDTIKQMHSIEVEPGELPDLKQQVIRLGSLCKRGSVFRKRGKAARTYRGASRQPDDAPWRLPYQQRHGAKRRGNPH